MKKKKSSPLVWGGREEDFYGELFLLKMMEDSVIRHCFQRAQKLSFLAKRKHFSFVSKVRESFDKDPLDFGFNR